MGLDKFERRIQGAVESVFARASKRSVEPIELGRRVVRELERNRKVALTSEIVPNVYKVYLSKYDFEELEPIAKAILAELKSLLVDTAEEHSYKFVGSIQIDFVEDFTQKAGSFYVESSFFEEEGYGDRFVLLLPDGRRIELNPGVFIIGRLPVCSLVVEDPRVSRRHCQIELVDSVAYLKDLGSTNGTYVNQQRITSEVPLVSGDEITVGGTRLVYLLE
ncbi:FHA domain-containing protein [Ferrithrix thermotolerans DSM 19514]|uniref:FHA domain-containing protein n=1 Tax=Ferrithrix thermotolerans DSM 19514 TaxID=1121881 RepID=A0A1M4UCU8_9ACTN|nr:DUF3662 and FHA domain-containing protein [Ferrithrix thermotolerans]SHE54486.1 FHA domain-containing protein [Ferrithrix thermotolerans DSM 19514]